MTLIGRKPDVQTFHPRWPDLGSLPPRGLRFTYDRPTDTLFIDLYGEAHAAASIPLDRGDRDYLCLRIDPATDEVVGVQIEHFLSYAIARHPELRTALDLADLVGIDRDDLDRLVPIQTRTTGHDPRIAALESVKHLCA